jgi:hypothetical protein
MPPTAGAGCSLTRLVDPCFPAAYPYSMRFLVLRLLALFAPLTLQALPPEQETFWKELTALCGKAFAGKVVESTSPTDAQFAGKTLVMHVRVCGPEEIRIPFHVGEDRSRTWIVARTASGLRLKHDHRHADGTEDKITHYGGDTANAGTAARQEFAADPFTVRLIPAAKTNVWSLLVTPEKIFSYGLRRDSEGRRFRVEFDLTKPIPAPPPAWGSR